MRVLIAGATGLIGKRLVELCHEDGIDVHYLTSNKNKIQNLPNYKGFYWNVKEQYIDTRAFEGVTTLINLAGYPVSNRWTSRNKELIYSSRIDATNLLHFYLKRITHNLVHYISASAIGIYPPSTTTLYSENCSHEDNGFLGKVVQDWEKAADAFKDLGCRLTKVRTGVVLDAKEGAFPKMLQPIKMGVGSALGSGKQWMSWIHVNDVARIYLYCIMQGKEGVINAVSPSPVTNAYLTKAIADALNKNLWVPKVPNFVLKLILGEMSTLALDGQLVHSEVLNNEEFTFQYVNVEAAIKNLLS